MLRKLMHRLFRGHDKEKETMHAKSMEPPHKVEPPVTPVFRIQDGCLIAWAKKEEVLRVPEGVKAIRLDLNYGQKDFLRQAILPDGLIEIGEGVFSGCHSLENADIPDTVERIGKEAFKGCYMMHSTRLPSALKEIGEFAFDYVCWPETVVIPAGIERIERYTFADCSGMKRVVIPASVSHIGEYAFTKCKDLETVIFETDDKEEVPLQIGEGAFAKSALMRIELPSRVTQLSNSMFDDCRNLTLVSLPARTSEIPARMFENCRALQQVDGLRNVERIEDCAFFLCETLLQLSPMEKLRHIGAYAFAECRLLQKVTLPAKFESIGERAFSHCNALVEITIPDGIAVLGEHAFEYCRDLDTVAYSFANENEDAFIQTAFWRRRKQLPPIPHKLPDHIHGDISGEKLREMGYCRFSPGREYFIDWPNQAGVVHVSSFCEEEGPDEDGYGREILYDHWLMDERLEPIPGIKSFFWMSSHSMHCREAEWQAELEKAASMLNLQRSEYARQEQSSESSGSE